MPIYQRVIFYLFSVLQIFIIVARVAPIRAYAVFGKEQIDLHKYAAILAASEPQRAIRDQEIKVLMDPISFWIAKLNGKIFNNPSSKLRKRNNQIDAVCSDYERRLLDVVVAYGLDAETFNDLSGIISKEKKLKKKVLLQAFYYKLAADLESNLASEIVKSQILLQTKSSKPNEPSSDSKIYGNIVKNNIPKPIDDKKVRMNKFTRALKDIEEDRVQLRRDLLV